MKWGTGREPALARMAELTAEDLKKKGVTSDIASAWQDFYRGVALAKPNNPSADARAMLMQRALELLTEET
jgi:hypothetical protein